MPLRNVVDDLAYHGNLKKTSHEKMQDNSHNKKIKVLPPDVEDEPVKHILYLESLFFALMTTGVRQYFKAAQNTNSIANLFNNFKSVRQPKNTCTARVAGFKIK